MIVKETLIMALRTSYTKKEKEQIYKDIQGSRQGHLIVLRLATEDEIQQYNKPKNHGKLWLCQCD